MNYKERIKRVTLKTRNTLKILTALKALNELPEPVRKINSKSERLTISASKIFILSDAYAEIPSPSIFKNISHAKMIVKIKFMLDMKLSPLSLVTIPSSDKMIVLIITQIMTEFSKNEE
jgi:hypothetical protein